MSETLNIESTYAAEFESQTFESTNSGDENRSGEEKDTQWGNGLTALVRANENVIVKCAWMGGAKVTVSEAMNAFDFPPNLTAEDEPFLMGIVYDLLANRVEETKELEEEPEEEKDEEPEEAETKAEEEEVKPKTEKINDQRNNHDPVEKQLEKKMELGQKDIENPAVRNQKVEPEILDDKKPIETEVINNENLVSPAPEVKTISEPEKSLTFEPPARDGREAFEVIAQAVSEPAETPRTSGASADTVEPEISLASETPAIESPPDIPIHETSVNEPVKEPETAPPVFNEVEMEHPGLAIDSKAVDDFEPADISPLLEAEDSFNADEVLPLFDEMPELDEYEIPLAGISQVETADSADFFEAEIWIDHVEEISWPPELSEQLVEASAVEYDEEAEIPLPDIDETPRHTDTTSQEQAVTIDSMIEVEAVEQALTSLIEYIETDEPEAVETVNEILDEIVEATERLEFKDEEISASPDEAQEEIEKLFTELLDVIGIGYSPELVESLARLALKWNSPAETEDFEIQQEAGANIHDSGTHEIIKKILIGLSDSQSITQAYSVGKSALQLYSLQLRLSQTREAKILPAAA